MSFNFLRNVQLFFSCLLGYLVTYSQNLSGKCFLLQAICIHFHGEVIINTCILILVSLSEDVWVVLSM